MKLLDPFTGDVCACGALLRVDDHHGMCRECALEASREIAALALVETSKSFNERLERQCCPPLFLSPEVMESITSDHVKTL